jgi:hypothetical protein
MASEDDVKGEGFEILGDETTEKAEGEQPARPAAERSAGHEGEELKGEGFEILDHEEPAPSESEAERGRADQEGKEGGSEAAAGEQEERIAPIDVYSVLRLAVAQLTGVAWQMMGLQPDPFTNQVRKDIAQARIAIDAAEALVEHLKPHLRGQEARDYENLLTDLRLNFVSHSSEKPGNE